MKHESSFRVKLASVLGTDNGAANPGRFYERMPSMVADIRKAIDLPLGVLLKEERFSDYVFSSRRRHTISVSAFLLNRSSDLLAAQPVTTNLLKFMRASIKMIGVSNLQSFIAS